MRRHVGRAEQTDTSRPELQVAGAVHARVYGSAVHEVLRLIEEGFKPDKAIQKAWNEYGRSLDPGDLDLLREDIATYELRDFPGTRTVLLEEEIRVPLFEHNGVQIFFRARIDRLYERIDRPGQFVHVDYKSSKWPKSQAEIDDDLQMWSYNWSVHEYFAECDGLSQWYDQLSAGQIPTRKSDDQRRQIREWLIAQVTAILEDEEWQPDELLKHSFNEWCPWCPIMESCPVIADLTTYAATRIAVLAPERPKLKADGTAGKRKEAVPLDPGRIEEYTAELQKAKRAGQVLDRFVGQVNGILRTMPHDDRQALGFKLRGKSSPTWTPEAARQLHERFGEQFYELVKVTRTALESGLSPEDLEWAVGLAEKRASTPSVLAA